MVKKIICFSIVLIFFFTLSVEAQRWKRYRYEFSYGLGATNFMGDIGAPAVNFITEYFYLNPYFFRPVGQIGLGYLLHERINTKANLHIGMLNADDRYGEWSSRNLYFNSLIIETSVQAEFYFIKEKRKRNIYRYRSRFKRKFQNLNIPTYIFGGFGGVLSSSNLKLAGTWPDQTAVNLGGESTLGRKTLYTMTFPIGIGFKYKLSNRIYAGLEASLRYTLSDEIDNHIPTASKWIDSYQFLVFSLNYKLKSTRSGLPRFKMTY